MFCFISALLSSNWVAQLLVFQASGKLQTYITKYHDWPDATQCRSKILPGFSKQNSLHENPNPVLSRPQFVFSSQYGGYNKTRDLISALFLSVTRTISAIKSCNSRTHFRTVIMLSLLNERDMLRMDKVTIQGDPYGWIVELG